MDIASEARSVVERAEITDLPMLHIIAFDS
jgi:hypothetical protein